MKKENWKVFYPLLFGIYPALGLVAFNITQITLFAGLRSVLISIVLILGIYAILCWRVKDKDKSALLCGWFIIFFFAYGHVYDVLNGWTAFGIILGRQLFLFPLWLIVFGVGAWVIFTKAKRLQFVSQTLNIVSVILVLMPVITIVRMDRERSHPSLSKQANVKLASPSSSTTAAQFPDVYYIILDGYTRGDMLLRDYGLDIIGFVGQLEKIGFYIKRSTIPPIIILQADHGWDLDARMANFNALYFPNGGDKVLYPTLTPVNTFRLAFDTYFGQEFPLLPDASYYSTNEDPLNFTKVQYPCKP